MRKAFLLALCLVPSLAWGRPKYCHDLLALQHKDFPAVAPYLDKSFCGGNLDWTFGESLEPLKAVLASGKVYAWRTHFFNGPGLRGGALGPYEPHFGMSVSGFNAAWERGGGGKLRHHLVVRSRAYCRVFRRYPWVSLEISPTLEHNLSHTAFREQVKVVHRYCPQALVIDNPVAGVPALGGFVVERHGAHPGGLEIACNVSLDGDDVNDVNFPEYLKTHRQCTVYTWTHEYNCRKRTGPFEDPRERTACPTKSLLKRLLSQ